MKARKQTPVLRPSGERCQSAWWMVAPLAHYAIRHETKCTCLRRVQLNSPSSSRNIDDGSLNCKYICLHASKQISLSLSLSLSLTLTLYCLHGTILNVPRCPFTRLLPSFAPFATLHCYKFLHQSGKSNSNFEKQKYGTPATISSFVSSYWIISLRFNSRSARERRGWGGGVGDEWTKAVTTSRLQQPLAVL